MAQFDPSMVDATVDFLLEYGFIIISETDKIITMLHIEVGIINIPKGGK